jgi:hypothetical protein
MYAKERFRNVAWGLNIPMVQERCKSNVALEQKEIFIKREREIERKDLTGAERKIV